jgi:predicted GNAT family N-acyltransferase
MPTPFVFAITRAQWPRDETDLRVVRTAVFIDEQNVAPELEWDGRDAHCLHVIARDANGTPVGTGRLLPEGKIGRMAVLHTARGHGVGAAILAELLNAAREGGFEEIELSAQMHALGFYARAGFVAEGGQYMDAGIPHRTMRLRLKNR